MPSAPTATLQPRKRPIQARSGVTVEAILDAALQVLVAVGKQRLTTTRVAHRAGVSVGTLYQYFPNKTALLRACLERHMASIRNTMEQGCESARHLPLREMGLAVRDAYLAAKMENPSVSAALYAISSDIDGAALSRATSVRITEQVAALFATAPEQLTRPPDVVATVLLATLQGIARRAIESAQPAEEFARLRHEISHLIEAYLSSCIASD